MACPGCSRPLCNWIASRPVCNINVGGTVVTWEEKSNISMVRRCSQSVPARPNQRTYKWHIADWETEVGLLRALRLWQQSVAWHKLRKAKRRLQRGTRKWKQAGTNTERFLVHPKGGPPGDHLEWLWMEGIPSKAPARTAGSLDIILDHLEWTNSKAHPCTQANCNAQVTEKKRRGLPPGPNGPSWMERIPSNAQGAPAGSLQEILGYLEWSRRKVPNGLQAAGCRECPGRQAEEVPHHQRLKRSRTTKGPAPPGLLWDRKLSPQEV